MPTETKCTRYVSPFYLVEKSRHSVTVQQMELPHQLNSHHNTEMLYKARQMPYYCSIMYTHNHYSVTILWIAGFTHTV